MGQVLGKFSETISLFFVSRQFKIVLLVIELFKNLL